MCIRDRPSASPPGRPSSSDAFIRSCAARFTSRTAAQPFSSRFTSIRSRVMPALWMIAYSRASAPYRSATCAAIRSPASGTVMSSCSAVPWISLTTFASASPDAGTSTPTTVAPSRANVRAMAAPIPRAAPVMATIFPSYGLVVRATSSSTWATPTRHDCPSTYADRPSSRNRSVDASASGEVSGSTHTRFEVAPPRSSFATVRFRPSKPCASTRGSSSSYDSGVRAMRMIRPLRSRLRIAGRNTPRTYSSSVTVRSPVRSITSAPKRPSYPGGTGLPDSPVVRASGVSTTGSMVSTPSRVSVRRARVPLSNPARETAPPGRTRPRRRSTVGGTPSFVATNFPTDEDAIPRAIASSPVGQLVATKLGVPPTVDLRRGRVLPGGRVSLAGLDNGTLARRTLTLLGVETIDPVVDTPDARTTGESGRPVPPGYEGRLGALVIDLTGLRTVTELEYVRGVLRPAIRSLERSGRIILIARTPESYDELEPRVLAQGLDGLNRTVAKELRGGATSNLVWVDPETSPEALASTLRFLLEGRSAYVDGQSWRVGVAQVDEDVARTTRPYDGKIVAITGAARGIGAAIARTFARDGATVVGVDVPASGEALAKVVNEIHGTALQLDITVPDAGERIAAHVAERYGADARLYAIIHNAGITRDRMLVNLDEKGWAAVLDVNLAAQLRMNASLLDGRPGGLADVGNRGEQGPGELRDEQGGDRGARAGDGAEAGRPRDHHQRRGTRLHRDRDDRRDPVPPAPDLPALEQPGSGREAGRCG